MTELLGDNRKAFRVEIAGRNGDVDWLSEGLGEVAKPGDEGGGEGIPVPVVDELWLAHAVRRS